MAILGRIRRRSRNLFRMSNFRINGEFCELRTPVVESLE